MIVQEKAAAIQTNAEDKKATEEQLKNAHEEKVKQVETDKEELKEAKSKLKTAQTAAEQAKDKLHVAKGLVGFVSCLCVFSHFSHGVWCR